MVRRLLKLFSYQGDIVLDPFSGVGTTTLVAYKLKRRYIGIDISKEYCKTADCFGLENADLYSAAYGSYIYRENQVQP